MALEFSGTAKRFDDEAIEAAAAKIGCPVAAVRAVIDVESRGGFLADGRPKILFERHYFRRLTDGAHDSKHPDISAKLWGGYKGGAAEYERLHRAIDLKEREAALKSASWGAFQIMGSNFAVCGFPDVEKFVEAMVAGEPQQLGAFVAFVKGNNLDDELRRLDWVGFARGYNGPDFRKNKYDEKLAAAYRYHSAGGARTTSPLPVLRMGDRGDEVETLQKALKVKADGDFGPGTKAAVVAFQKEHGLYPDGVVGKNTWAKLGVG
jgi:hypothetical protein